MGGCKLDEDRTAPQVMWGSFSDLLWKTQDQTNTSVWVLHEEYKIDDRDIVQGQGQFVEVSVRSRDKMVTIDETLDLATCFGDEQHHYCRQIAQDCHQQWLCSSTSAGSHLGQH